MLLRIRPSFSLPLRSDQIRCGAQYCLCNGTGACEFFLLHTSPLHSAPSHLSCTRRFLSFHKSSKYFFLLSIFFLSWSPNNSNSSTSSASLIPWISLMPPRPRHSFRKCLSVSSAPDSLNQSTKVCPGGHMPSWLKFALEDPCPVDKSLSWRTRAQSTKVYSGGPMEMLFIKIQLGNNGALRILLYVTTRCQLFVHYIAINKIRIAYQYKAHHHSVTLYFQE